MPDKSQITHAVARFFETRNPLLLIAGEDEIIIQIGIDKGVGEGRGQRNRPHFAQLQAEHAIFNDKAIIDAQFVAVICPGISRQLLGTQA